MKILQATKLTQGNKKSDFSFVPENEIVKLGSVCCRSARCGCDRSMVGVNTLTATTTFKVVESPIKIEELAKILSDSYEKAGWGKVIPTTIDEFVEEARTLIEVAMKFPTGSVLEIKRGRITQRKPLQA